MTESVPPKPQPASDTLNCPSCAQSITYYDVEASYYYGCPNCHTYFKYENEGPPEILMKFPAKGKEAILTLGTEGYLESQWVRVVGYLHRKEQGTNYDWREYALLQTDGTYVMLAEYDGHWSYIKPLPKTANYTQYGTGGKKFYVDTETRQYRLYGKYKPQTLLAIGEFDWNVLDEDKLTVSEYINPPYLLVAERTQGQTQGWYEGHYLFPKDVANAFGLTPADLPGSVGTGSIEPPYKAETWQAVLNVTAVALGVLLLCQLVVMMVKPRSVVLNTSFVTQREPGTVNDQFKPVVTQSFQINGPAALEIDLSADIDNQWAELPVSLVNETTGQSYEFTKALEYYHGTDGGENWTEGSRSEEAELSGIPSGQYHVNLYPFSDNKTGLSGNIKITQNPTMFLNLLILALLMLLYPLYLFLRRSSLETLRWQNSDFADEES